MYYVSRQKYYYSGESVVEIAQGGIDYSGSDMLCSKYRGEGEEYADPREAVKTAVSICKQWRDSGEDCHVAAGFNHGMGMEFEPENPLSLWTWAKKTAHDAPKCCWCGAFVKDEDNWNDQHGEPFTACDRVCADTHVEAEEQFQAEFDAEEN